MGDRIDISGLGKLSIADKVDAPLLVVFGGTAVDKEDLDGIHREKETLVSSGDYMWTFMSGIQSRYHIFVAVSQDVDGKEAYEKLISKLQDQKLSPSSQILYLFSGGWRPGRKVLLRDEGTDPFKSIFLVDIWMGVTKKSGSMSPDFYKALASKHTDMITYVFTEHGAVNDKARDFIANLVPKRAILVDPQEGEHGRQTHMRTNTVAVGMLP